MDGKKDSRSRTFGYAVIAFALLPVGDAIAKSMAGEWPGTSIAALRYLFGAVGLCAILFWREGKAGFRCPLPWVQIGRAASVGISACCFFAGVQLMPLAEMTAISFTSPIIVALLSAAFLGEPARRPVWIATALSLVGMLIVIRPNIADVGWAGLLPLISATGFATMIIFNRMSAGSGSALQMQMLISVIALPIITLLTIAGNMSGLANLEVTLPSASVIARCATMAVTASASHALLYMATERTTAAAIGPLVYVQLLVALGLGAAFFGDLPDGAALGGAALIIGAGLYLWRRG